MAGMARCPVRATGRHGHRPASVIRPVVAVVGLAEGDNRFALRMGHPGGGASVSPFATLFPSDPPDRGSRHSPAAHPIWPTLSLF